MKSGAREFLADFTVSCLQGVRMIFLIPRGACRFSPTCSVYAREALLVFPPHIAVFKIVWRILRCNPFSKGGFDPVDGSFTNLKQQKE